MTLTKSKTSNIAKKVYDLAAKESDTKPIAVLVLFPDNDNPDFMYSAVRYDKANTFEDTVDEIKTAITHNPNFTKE